MFLEMKIVKRWNYAFKAEGHEKKVKAKSSNFLFRRGNMFLEMKIAKICFAKKVEI